MGPLPPRPPSSSSSCGNEDEKEEDDVGPYALRSNHGGTIAAVIADLSSSTDDVVDWILDIAVEENRASRDIYIYIYIYLFYYTYIYFIMM